MRKQQTIVSYFTCPECGMVFPIQRKKAKMKKANHIKDLWCPKCGKISKFSQDRY